MWYKICQFCSSAYVCRKLFSDVLSKTFVYKSVWYQEVFQIISTQPSGKNLLFLQGYLESPTNKSTCLKVFWKMHFFYIYHAKAQNILRSLKIR